MSSSRRISMSTLVGGPAKAKEPAVAGTADEHTDRLIYVKTDRLLPNPHNPRDDIGDLEDLKSIAKIQRQSLLIVTRAAYLKLYPDEIEQCRGIDFVVVNGCRRHAAAVKWGREQLACAVNDTVAVSRAALARAAYDENNERRGFDPIEDAKAVMQVVSEYATAKEAATQEGWSEGWISQRKGLLRLHPEVQDLVRLHSQTGGKEGIAIRAARGLAAVKGIESMSSSEQLAQLDRLEREAAAKKAEAAVRKAGKQTRPVTGSPPGAPAQTGQPPEFTAVNSAAPPASGVAPASAAARSADPAAGAGADADPPGAAAAAALEFTAVNSSGLPASAAQPGEQGDPTSGARGAADPGHERAEEGGQEFTAVNSSDPDGGSPLPGQRDELREGVPAVGVDWHNVDAFAEAILKRLSHEEAFKLADALASRVREAMGAEA